MRKLLESVTQILTLQQLGPLLKAPSCALLPGIKKPATRGGFMGWLSHWFQLVVFMLVEVEDLSSPLHEIAYALPWRVSAGPQL